MLKEPENKSDTLRLDYDYGPASLLLGYSSPEKSDELRLDYGPHYYSGLVFCGIIQHLIIRLTETMIRKHKYLVSFYDQLKMFLLNYLAVQNNSNIKSALLPFLMLL